MIEWLGMCGMWFYEMEFLGSEMIVGEGLMGREEEMRGVGLKNCC